MARAEYKNGAVTIWVKAAAIAGQPAQEVAIYHHDGIAPTLTCTAISQPHAAINPERLMIRTYAALGYGYLGHDVMADEKLDALKSILAVAQVMPDFPTAAKMAIQPSLLMCACC